MLEAKDLPKCDLSNYLSERLDSVLEHDRKMRADRDGCPIEHVSPFKHAMPFASPDSSPISDPDPIQSGPHTLSMSVP